MVHLYHGPLLILLSGCSKAPENSLPEVEGEVEGDTAEPSSANLLDDVAWLARMSLDLRGVRPSAAELEQVLADPTAIDDLLDAMLDDARFPERMAWLWNDSIHTAVWGARYTRFDWDFATWKAIGWEPLAVIELVLQDHRPFSDIVTASQTPVQAELAAVWDLPAASAEWTWGSYEDERPMAGILSTNALWLRYTADAVNYNRTRANTVASLLLCSDSTKPSSAPLLAGSDLAELLSTQLPLCGEGRWSTRAVTRPV